MKNKMIKYLILDSFLVIIFLLLFDKMAINTTFHEIAGLVMLCTCLLHVALHPSYVINVTKKALSKNLSGKQRFSYILNILLLLLVLVMIINSLQISKVILNHPSNNHGIAVHKTLAALMLFLVGIHLGLHYTLIKSKMRIKKPLSTILITLILVFGVYSLGTSKYISYVTALSQQGPGQLQSGGRGEGKGQGRGLGTNHEESPTVSPVKIGTTLVTYGSLVYVFCFATHLIEQAVKRSQKKKKKKITI